ncbi:hypothetical protein BN988_02946 [Oceanobacillus picturae]|uniref:Uncharacterized protein n=1 Tax=Oceanobacillus picturae TaxID=171693 RepID=W9AF83_9BACI|nr:hypothetical protein [Oceanobacillus picturae]CDO04389.1 hypothetical protein BN988_02946 [Oceanobacillus picturae]
MKKMIPLAILIVLAATGTLLYYFYPSSPEEFYTTDEAKELINEVYPEAKVDVVQEIVKVTDYHAFVPFISEDNYMGASFWEWKNHKWKLTIVKNSLLPKIWRIDKEDPEEAYIVWNIHPAMETDKLGIYMHRPRHYYEMEEVEHYEPQFQFEEIYSLKEHTYGAKQIPAEWAITLKNYYRLEEVDYLREFITGNAHMRIGWYPLNEAERRDVTRRGILSEKWHL